MPDYKKMYLELFNSITNAIEILKEAQIKSEDMYINSEEENNILKIRKNDDELS